MTATRCDIYCRLSVDRSGDAVSVARQEADSRAVAERMGWAVDAVHVDNSLSAWRTTVRRPGWEQLLERIRARAIDAVVVYHGDRLMRQPRDLEALIEAADVAGVRLASTVGTRDLASADDRFILRIEVAAAARESDNTSRRVRRAKADAAQAGRPNGGGRRFGYTADHGAVVASEALEVERMARAVLAGGSVYGVVADLTARGVRTARGGEWSPTTVRALLRSPGIAGLRLHHGQVVGAAAWPPILDRATWEAVQVILAPEARTVAVAGLAHWCSGLLVCGSCARPMHAARTGTAGRRAYKCAPGAGGCGRAVDVARTEDALASVLLATLDRAPAVEPTPDPTEDTLDADRARLRELGAWYAAQDDVSLAEYGAMRGPLAERVRAAESARRRRTPALARLTGGDLAAGWLDLDPAGRRAVALDLWERVDVAAAAKTGRGSFDPDRLTIVWR